MPTPELSFSTPAKLLAALSHLLEFVPVNDLVALMLTPGEHPLAVPMGAAIHCPITIDDEQAQRFPATCGLTAARFPGAILVAVAFLTPERETTCNEQRTIGCPASASRR